MMWDELSFAPEVDPAAVTEPERFPAKPGTSPLDRYMTLPSTGNEQILALEDVEEFLENVEARRDDDVPVGEPASPEFYGRTTPMLYADDPVTFGWPDGGVPYSSYTQQPCGRALAYTDVAGLGTQGPLDVSQTYTSLQLVGADSTRSAQQQLSVVVPNFDLLAGAISPVSVHTFSTSDTKYLETPVIQNEDCTTETMHDDTKPLLQPGSAQAPETPKVKVELRETIKKRRKASGKDAIVIDWEDKPKEENQLTERDLDRRERRRDSNRRAAQKSRIKKREQNMNIAQDMAGLAEENERLQVEVDALRAELAETTSFIRQHLLMCPQPGEFARALSPPGDLSPPSGSGRGTQGCIGVLQGAKPAKPLNPHR